jgi:hypothetical protein
VTVPDLPAYVAPQWDFDEVPLGMWDGANRYDTDDEHVLTLWRKDGTTFDLRAPRRPFATPANPDPGTVPDLPAVEAYAEKPEHEGGAS